MNMLGQGARPAHPRVNGDSNGNHYTRPTIGFA
jgi:hypothetical protein